MSPYSDTTSNNSSSERRGVQHPFQLCQQRNHFCSFYTYESVATNDGDNKKKKLYPRLLA